MKVHDVKCWPDFFQPLFDGRKPFEVRKNDRSYLVGDVMLIREWDDRKGVYTGRQVRKRITWVHEGVPGGIAPLLGLARDYVVLGLVDEANP